MVPIALTGTVRLVTAWGTLPEKLKLAGKLVPAPTNVDGDLVSAAIGVGPTVDEAAQVEGRQLGGRVGGQIPN